MNRENIIRMAQEADPFGKDGRLYVMAQLTPETLERFAALVASAEREACANAMAKIVMTPTLTHGALVKLSDVVNASRARGQA